MSGRVNMDPNTENLLDEGPGVDFNGAMLQIHPDQNSRSPSSLGDDSESVAKLLLSPEMSNIGHKDNGEMDDHSLKPAVSAGTDIVSPIISMPQKISQKLKRSWSAPRTDMACQIRTLGEDEAKDFFTYRDGLVENAVKECISKLIVPENDGEIVGSWLLTEISIWDNEKERLVLLTTQTLTTVKYDFIALKHLEHRKINLQQVDTLVIGDLLYPSGSLVPRLNGLASGVVTVVKGCLLRPLQERWASTSATNRNFCGSPFDFVNFEPRSRNTRGLRVMWNRGQPLAFSKKWNPFNNEIPWTTFASHPLLWHKEPDGEGNRMYDVEDFARCLVTATERAQLSDGCSAAPCRVEHKPIILQNYVGLSSLIHNRNALGFFKVRGKFSF